jgi:hypothetical protein
MSTQIVVPVKKRDELNTFCPICKCWQNQDRK